MRNILQCENALREHAPDYCLPVKDIASLIVELAHGRQRGSHVPIVSNSPSASSRDGHSQQSALGLIWLRLAYFETENAQVDY